MPNGTDDDLYDEDFEVEPDTTQQRKKNPVADQRRYIKELEGKLKELEPEVEELRSFKTQYDSEVRDSTIKNVFGELGVAETAAKFYKLEFPEGEVTKEAVAKWAVENQFAAPDQFSGTESSGGGFEPSNSSGGSMPGIKTYSRKEFERLLSTGNPADTVEANKAIAEGRVNLIRED